MRISMISIMNNTRIHINNSIFANSINSFISTIQVSLSEFNFGDCNTIILFNNSVINSYLFINNKNSFDIKKCSFSNTTFVIKKDENNFLIQNSSFDGAISLTAIEKNFLNSINFSYNELTSNSQFLLAF